MKAIIAAILIASSALAADPIGQQKLFMVSWEKSTEHTKTINELLGSGEWKIKGVTPLHHRGTVVIVLEKTHVAPAIVAPIPTSTYWDK